MRKGHHGATFSKRGLYGVARATSAHHAMFCG